MKKLKKILALTLITLLFSCVKKRDCNCHTDWVYLSGTQIGAGTVPSGGRDNIYTNVTEDFCDDREKEQNYIDEVGGVKYERVTNCVFN